MSLICAGIFLAACILITAIIRAFNKSKEASENNDSIF